MVAANSSSKKRTHTRTSPKLFFRGCWLRLNGADANRWLMSQPVFPEFIAENCNSRHPYKKTLNYCKKILGLVHSNLCRKEISSYVRYVTYLRMFCEHLDLLNLRWRHLIKFKIVLMENPIPFFYDPINIKETLKLVPQDDEYNMLLGMKSVTEIKKKQQ